MKTIAIDSTEEAEFFALVGEDSKWGKRLKGAQSFMGSCLSTESWFKLSPCYLNPEKLPDVLHVGHRVRFSWWENGKTVYYMGTITSHYIDGDDCSGTWGEAKYGIKRDSPPKGHEHYSEPVKHCTLLD